MGAQRGFTHQKRFRKPHFSEFKGSGISVFEFYRGLNFLSVVVLKVSGFEGCRVLVLELFLLTNGGAAGFYTPKKMSETTLFRVLRVPGFQSLNFTGVYQPPGTGFLKTRLLPRPCLLQKEASRICSVS